MSFIRISSLQWADILVAYAIFFMQNYFTEVWKLSLTHAAAILNFWNGIYRMLPVFFLYLVDTFLGNFRLLVFTSLSYVAGICFVALSAPPMLAKSTHTCKQYEPQCIGRTQRGLLYAGLALIAVGRAGVIVSLMPFIREQRDITTREAATDRLGLICSIAVGVFGKAIPFIKSWALRFGIPAICTAVFTFTFMNGSCFYRWHLTGTGSPLSNVCRVFVAAARKILKPYPGDNEGYHGINRRSFSSTSCLQPLHKAAIILPGEEVDEDNISRWKLCSVAEVEDAKIAVRMVPMWMTFIVCGIVSSAGDTYFVEQAGKLNRHVGKLKLPIEVLLVARMSTKYLLKPVVGCFLKRIKKESAPAFGIALGMICSVLCCVAAAGTERMRLKVVTRNGLLDKEDEDVPMSMYWLIFQFVLLGGVDSFLEKSVNAYYRDQSPDSMEAYLHTFTHFVSGQGFMCSSLSVYVVGRISERGGRRNWFQRTLNESRLDRYYWVLAAWSSLNLVVFVVVASRYRYKKRGGGGEELGEREAGDSHTEGNVVVENVAKSFCCCC